MPPPMPKHLAKGGVAQMLDQRYGDEAGALETLRKLRARDALGVPTHKLYDIGTMEAAGKVALDLAGNPKDPTGIGSKEHLRDHWLGENDYIDPAKESTGWWHNYNGDPEGVLREGLERALEVALGIDHDPTNPHPETQTRNRIKTSAPGTNSTSGGFFHSLTSLFGGSSAAQTAEGAEANPPAEGAGGMLPIDTYWICGLPKFEVYVCWNTHQVTFIILTPGFSYTATDPEGDDPWVEDFPTNEIAAPHVNQDVMRRQAGILFVGQNVDQSDTTIARMLPGVFVNNLHDAAPPTPSRSGIGAA